MRRCAVTAEIHYLPTAVEHIAIERATAHSAHESVLEPLARWQGGEVDDLAVARAMRLLEGGARITCARGRWTTTEGAPFGKRISPVINEMIRTGLVTHVRMHGVDVLVPALVHLGLWNGRQARWTAACAPVGENMGPKRVRLHRDPIIVDCLACLDSL